jgi:hypothetical protein
MNTCPVCGYPALREPPRAPSGGGSYEICPSCGFQFGVDDDDKGITYEDARKRWVTAGHRWQSRGMPAPGGWDAVKQLQKLVEAADSDARQKAPRPRGDGRR